MIIVNGKAKAKQLCTSGLQFRRAIKVIERYQKAELSSAYIKCCNIRYQQKESSRD